MSNDKVIKGVLKGFGQLGMETVEKAKEEGSKILESIITGKELLGLDRTMSDSELDFKKQEEEKKSREEAEKLRKEIGPGRKVEDEMTQMRKQEEKDEEEKEKYYQQMEERKRQEQQQQEEYDGLMMQSSNPAKQKKSRGSAMAHKKKSQPDQSQMSQTSEFKGKID